jgi:hypothetical protein
LYPAIDTDGDQHCDGRTMRVNLALFDPIFIQYIIIKQRETLVVSKKMLLHNLIEKG